MLQTLQIVKLDENDAERLWRLRLDALQSEPEAFGESLEEHLQTSIDKYASRLRSSCDDNFVMGAVDGSELVGMAGFWRDQNRKECHKGHIWGVFVAPAHRGKRVGHALIGAILDRARNLPGLVQVQLVVCTKATEACNLYSSCGFRSFGVEPQALVVNGHFVDEEHMVLLL
jgi:RimJ/RimL family protein N-acetyltransferase